MLITRSVVAAVIGAAVLVPTSAGAADATSSGWWTRAPVAVAPDAQGALVVQGGAQSDQPVSYAAVTFTLAPGEHASRLVLAVAPSSASTPSSTLTVCALTGSFAPADGGNIADAPPYDCRSTASAAASSGQFSFDVSTFTAEGTLALAVLPSAASDRVALVKPTGDALQTARGDTGTTDAGGSPAALAPGTVASDTSVSEGSPLPVVTFDAPATPPASAPTAAASTPAPDRVTPRSLDAAPAAAATNGDHRRPAAPIVFVLLVLVAGGLWLAAGHVAGDPDDVDADGADLTPG